MNSKLGQLLAWVGKDLDNGPILAASGSFDVEVESGGGHDIADHDMPCAPSAGLLLFEGWISVGATPDPDVFFEGQWRSLTHWEMCRLMVGELPWDPSQQVIDDPIPDDAEPPPGWERYTITDDDGCPHTSLHVRRSGPETVTVQEAWAEYRRLRRNTP